MWIWITVTLGVLGVLAVLGTIIWVKRKETPLHRAVRRGDVDAAKLLLANRADLGAGTVFGETPLHWAARYGQRELAELLLANGADVNAKDGAGWTPLRLAESWARTQVADLLRKHGVKRQQGRLNENDTMGCDSLRAVSGCGVQHRPTGKRQTRIRTLCQCAGGDVTTTGKMT